MIYDYNALTYDLEQIRYGNVFSIGQSFENRTIYCIKYGNGPKKVFLNGAHCAMEWLTSALMMQYAQNLEATIPKNSVYIVPMVNPDGVEKVKRDNSVVWQANARGVDLNYNYDDEQSKSMETGILEPGPTHYGGEYPFSEKETIALRDFSIKEQFDIVLSYHCPGECIYYRYEDRGFYKTAKEFAVLTGYDVEQGIVSFQGYKDWFLKQFNRPAFSIQVGLGRNPLQLNQLETIYTTNKRLFNYIGEMVL